MSRKLAIYGLVYRDIGSREVGGLALIIMAFVASLSFADDPDLERISFHTIFFILCVSPYFLLSHKPRYRLLVFFMLVYYAMFGMLDYVLLFTNQDYRIFLSSARIPRTAFADIVILSGGVAVLVSYLAVATLWKRRGLYRNPPAWTYKASTIFGLICWIVGICAQFIVQFKYGTTGPSQVGILSHLVSNLYYLALLGGIIMIIAALNNPNARLAWLLLAIMIGAEFVFGFFGNIKEVSFRLPILVLITLFFLRGEINIKLIFVIIVVFIFYHTVFKIYRVQVLQVQEQSTLDAINKLDTSIDTITKAVKKDRGAAIRSLFFFLDRVDGRKYLEIITQNVGVKEPYLKGYSLKLYFYSFIPKVIWPEKPQISIGQLMNRTFGLSQSHLTFVPPTQLGEFYWNFGMPGVFIGMAFIGTLLGLINAAFLSGNQASTVGMLVIMVTFYFLVLRFESGFASQYNQYTRALFLISIIAILFYRFGWTKQPRSKMGNAGRQYMVTFGGRGGKDFPSSYYKPHTLLHDVKVSK